jgi:Secretion system C-terminal sorting domain
LIIQALNIPSAFQQDYKELKSKLHDNIKARTILMQEISQTSEPTTLQQHIDLMTSDIQHLEIEVFEKEAAIWSEQLVLIEKAKDLNNGLDVFEEYQTNEKTINDIYLSMLAHHTFTFNEDEINIINKIAAKCPLKGGRGVYIARMLQSILGETKDYSETDECGGGLALQLQQSEERYTQTENLGVSPNPASDQVILKYLPSDQVGVVYLYDMVGRKVLQSTVQPNSTEVLLNLKDFANGIYQILLIEGANRRLSQKITILR